jgi:four helix bundle protein
MAVMNYRELLVWQKAMDRVVACYQATAVFPRAELYGSCSQAQRAAVSIPANIAEGQGRTHTREFLNHLSYANGSRCELETHLILAERLGYLAPDHVDRLLEASAEIGRMLNGLASALERKLSL